MSDYDFRPGGSLKLKGVKDGRITKKKRKKPFKSEKNKKTGKNHLQETATDDVGTDTPRGSRQSTPEVNGSKTEAEKRFEEMQRERLAQRVAKMANKTHKDRVNEFNNKLEALSEHHDIPKVGPG